MCLVFFICSERGVKATFRFSSFLVCFGCFPAASFICSCCIFPKRCYGAVVKRQIMWLTAFLLTAFNVL